ncbi:putative lysosome-associated membrane glycoprotein 5 [Apostichopus japonicus]|uniref:Lysosome-associated membrane glycoprotein 5 n=1 Tax=Stichopus japonicus TaxID=307972 RepID=A0A2G8LR52_STIJA|nr:putative lysosome-associated membrane glycoprotein 5 [Apostichopus japonicus]
MAKLDNNSAQFLMVLLHLTVLHLVIISSDSVDNDYAYTTSLSSSSVPSNDQSTITPRPTTLKSTTIRREDDDVTEGVVGSQTSRTKATTIAKTTTKKQSTSSPDSLILQRGEFLLRDENGDICIKANFAINFKIYYKSKLSDQNEPSIPLSAKASVGGECVSDENTAFLTLQWKEDKYTLKFTFKKVPVEKRWIGERIQLTYDERDNPDFEGAVNPRLYVVQSSERDTFFSTKLGHSRSCVSEHDITLKNSESKDKVIMEITKLHLQPFDLKNGTFGEEIPCKSDLHKKGNNTASLVVGLLLAAFILVVIIGYAVGRKMGYITERSDYSTME